MEHYRYHNGMEEERKLEYEGVHHSNNIQRKAQEKVLVESSGSTEEVANNKTLCPLVGILPFTYMGLPIPYHGLLSPGDDPPDGFYHMAAVALAVKHFNERNPIVVKELSDPLYQQECNVEIPLSTELLRFGDSMSDWGATKFLLEQIRQNKPICGIVGPEKNFPSIEASAIARELGVPLVSHLATDNELKVEHYPHTILTSVNIHPMGEAMINWLRSIGRTDYVAFAHSSGRHPPQQVGSLDNAAKETNFTHVLETQFARPFTGYEPNRGIRHGLDLIKDSTYRTIILVPYDGPNPESGLIEFANAVEEKGLNNGDYVWMMNDNIDLAMLTTLAETNPNVTKFIEGLAVVRLLDGFDFNPALNRSDPFLEAWKSQDGDFVDLINELNPIQDENDPGYFFAKQDFFQTHKPVRGSGFIYDAVMAIGLGKCNELFLETYSATNEEEKAEEGEGNRKRKLVKGDKKAKGIKHQQSRLQKKKGPPPRGGPPVAGEEFVNAIINNEFTGATGLIQYGEGRWIRSRRRDTMTYGVYNFRPMEEQEKKVDVRTNRTHWFYLTDVLEGHPVDGTWVPVQNVNRPFQFSDGSNMPPLLLRAIPEQNYLTRGVQIFGLVLLGLCLVLVFLSALLVLFYKSRDAVRCAQPKFLLLLLFGLAIMSSSILVISFDESYGWDEYSLSIACAFYPWLVYMGYNTAYLALFSKLWRINKVLSFRRQRVLEQDVLGPLISLLTITVVILTAWSIHDPYTWEREVVDAVTGESYGHCVSEHMAWYMGSITIVAALSTILTGWMAWKTKDVDPQFADSRWIFYTIFLHLQVLIIGVPILIVLGVSSADVAYLGRVLLTSVICLTTILLMIGPKMMSIFSEGGSRGIDDFRGSNRGLGRGKGPVVTGLNNSPKSTAVAGSTMTVSGGETSVRNNSGRDSTHKSENDDAMKNVVSSAQLEDLSELEGSKLQQRQREDDNIN